MLHQRGTRSDVSADRLVRSLLGSNYGWLRASVASILWTLESLPEWIRPGQAEKLTLASMLQDRTLFFDEALTAALSSVEQVVVLGAGYDTRLFEFCLGRGLGLFEVDQIETQKLKRQALSESGIAVDEVQFVSVDFALGDWMEVLISSGFEPWRRTFFLWEGVTYYLTEEAVKKGFALMAAASGEGSMVAFDFFSKALVRENAAAIGTAVLDLIGEPLRFGVDTHDDARLGLAAVMAGTGFSLSELRLVNDWIGGSLESALPNVSGGVLGGLAIAHKVS